MNNSTLGQLVVGAWKSMLRFPQSGEVNLDPIGSTVAIVTGVTARWRAGMVASMVLVAMGCDLPERPPLPRARRGPTLDLDDIDAVRRAAGLPVDTPSEPEAIGPPPIGGARFAIETSPLVPGGTQVVGRRLRRVEVDNAATDRDADEINGGVRQWMIDPDLGSVFGQSGFAAGAELRNWKATADETTQTPVIHSSSEQLWIRRHRCSVLFQADTREWIAADGSLRRIAVRHQFGPMTRGSVAEVRRDERDEERGERKIAFRTGFGFEPAAPHWSSRSVPWTDDCRGMLATSSAVQSLLDAAASSDSGDKSSLLLCVLTPDADPDQLIGDTTRVNVQRVGTALVPSPVSTASGGSTSGDLKSGGSRSRALTEVTATSIAAESSEPRRPIREVYWADPDGVIQRKLRDDGLIERLVPPEDSIDLPSRPPGSAAVLTRGKPLDPDRATKAAFRIVGLEEESMAGESIAAMAAGPGQFIRRGENSVEVLLSRDGKADDSFEAFDREIVTADTAATRLVNYNEASMKKLSRAASSARANARSRSAVAEADPLNDEAWQAEPGPREGVDLRIAKDALAVTRSMMGPRPDEALFLPADQLVRRGGGGPLGRSIVLLTLLRGRGIAATLAMGVKVKSPLRPQQRWMGYHVWVLANLDGRWHTLDVADEDEASRTIDGPLPRIDRLLVTTCDPAEPQMAAAMQRTLQWMSRVDIDVVGVRN